ncbi:MAG TPA: hypothetical protein DHU55_14250 [Blastocatellia bacterium]|jgi:hypothetical protein|nr:hypothetical protein [Blastocatellia bacterium]HCX30909.1 hypothetical protein [Blastocatellia bacterium]
MLCPPGKQTLSAGEATVLAQASAIYGGKDFEYVQAGDAATAYARFPELEGLAQIARKVVSYDA